MYERNVARRILDHFGMLDDNAPTDLIEIARVQGVDIQPLDPNDNEASGWFRNTQDGPVILINQNRSHAHQRFTLAHELGHYFLKHGDAARDTAAQLRTRHPNEISANRFAAELLMPKQKVEDLLAEGYSQREMARIFDVSNEAMGYRLENLGNEYDREF